ncbi:MAG: putative addiction module antidote protein [Anaerolineales bacterium]|nr:putative addiction module antidote protein [Anaerolineales bacterium]
MTLETKPYEFAQHVETEEDIKAYLSAFLEEDGPQGFIDALGHLVRKKGMTEIARIAVVSRQNLYRTLTSEGSPNFITVNKVVEALGCKLAVV